MMLTSIGQAMMAAVLFVSRHGGQVSDWYVGVSNDPRAALFDRHKVIESLGMYLWFEMSDPKVTADSFSRLVEHGFLSTDHYAEIEPKFLYFFSKIPGVVL